MTTPNTQGDSWEREFDEKFCTERICKACLNEPCKYETTGCPWYQNTVLLNSEGGEVDTEMRIKAFIRTLLSKQRAEGERRGAEEERERLAIAVTHLKCWCGDCDKEAKVLDDVLELIQPATLPADSTEV